MQLTAAALQPVGNPARAASTQSTASGGRAERKEHEHGSPTSSPSTLQLAGDRSCTGRTRGHCRRRVGRYSPQRCSPLRAAEHPSDAESNRPQRHGSQPQPGSRGPAVSVSDRRSRRGRLRLDLRGHRRGGRIRATARTRRRHRRAPPTRAHRRCTGLTLRSPIIYSSREGGPQAALFLPTQPTKICQRCGLAGVWAGARAASRSRMGLCSHTCVRGGADRANVVRTPAGPRASTRGSRFGARSHRFAGFSFLLRPWCARASLPRTSMVRRGSPVRVRKRA